MEYTILILALPVLSFLILGLTGMYMKHRTAGWIGTLFPGRGNRTELSHRLQITLRRHVRLKEYSLP